ncbi:hypothetical protein PAXRUDRAFT_11411 [Paxillus rubicundulus Ve08.2h10]|uniref:Uncharacterized protein n=1 Tax=Paxillus rubicundulus Ve08.2h10 TaxID=930991 RepID=A0A0D0DYX0_9AGAM|nr:hypothetical protein PAXRUDRAFT_11411 [Paxillus rubicundulus Ve08.2h10]
MNLPEVEARLAAHLGHRYVDLDWRPALMAVMDAEGDVAATMKAIEPLADTAAHRTGIKICVPALGQPPSQLSVAEKTLMLSVNGLQQCNCIFGDPLSLEEILDPAKE